MTVWWRACKLARAHVCVRLRFGGSQGPVWEYLGSTLYSTGSPCKMDFCAFDARTDRPSGAKDQIDSLFHQSRPLKSSFLAIIQNL